ncbi:MAG TPA: hypothetical protein DCL00_05980 [Opitutae bacterium]|jgi:hypothetical protein|nr:hypothetical protein [Opitutae bacterium]|tara:strand:+ start:275 stop:538 length:264 start_codon:yes stop_codon:yes gene_type:complete
MTLNLNPSNSLTSNHSSALANIRLGFESLKKNNSQAGQKALNVDFSTQLNTNVTRVLAKGDIPKLLESVKADLHVHAINSQRASSLV